MFFRNNPIFVDLIFKILPFLTASPITIAGVRSGDRGGHNTPLANNTARVMTPRNCMFTYLTADVARLGLAGLHKIN